ncbi:hypothetical protein HPB50_010918 [Hyalomma asiaticum]|uniref:Uncharacterized protein n=1 Tax=Hyalomma asiaticum TaxID=266040 RepID=A0ACB7TA26_HYAAI|nr:hypothetical protein HPB50_010918 [Hyalomma asiaticum]
MSSNEMGRAHELKLEIEALKLQLEIEKLKTARFLQNSAQGRSETSGLGRYAKDLKAVLVPMPTDDTMIPAWFKIADSLLKMLEVPEEMQGALILPFLTEEVKTSVDIARDAVGEEPNNGGEDSLWLGATLEPPHESEKEVGIEMSVQVEANPDLGYGEQASVAAGAAGDPAHVRSVGEVFLWCLLKDAVSAPAEMDVDSPGPPPTPSTSSAPGARKRSGEPNDADSEGHDHTFFRE